jgi:hypothetical protein
VDSTLIKYVQMPTLQHQTRIGCDETFVILSLPGGGDPMDIWQPATADDASSGPASAAGAPANAADSSPVPAVSTLPVTLSTSSLTAGVLLGVAMRLGQLHCSAPVCTLLLLLDSDCSLVQPMMTHQLA